MSTPDSGVEKLARDAVVTGRDSRVDKMAEYYTFDQPVTDHTKEFLASSTIKGMESAGLLVLDKDGLVERITSVIYREGGEPGNSIHSWRCEYPERYGKCDCVDDLAHAVLAALTSGGGK